ncbi:MAG: hypothetical protein ACYTF5_08125, partial [Planctomycetota bacterium]
MEVHSEDEDHLVDEEREYFKTHEVLKGDVPTQDPLHDINAKKTITLLVVWTVALFLGIWVMTQLFHFMVQGERHRKVAESQKDFGPLAQEMSKLRKQTKKEL